MKVGIIFALYGESVYLEDCIKSIERNTKDIDYEIIKIQTKEPRISLGNAWNLGMIEAMKLGCDYFCILNDDGLVTRNWLSNMLDMYKIHSNVGVIVNVLSNFPGEQWKPFKECINPDQKLHTSYEVDDYSIEEIDKIAYKIEVAYKGRYFVSQRRGEEFCGACMVLSKEIFEKTGGFYDFSQDGTGLWMYKEDSDFYFRLWYLGYDIILRQDSLFFHYAGKTAFRLEEELDHDRLNELYSKRKRDILTKKVSPIIELK